MDILEGNIRKSVFFNAIVLFRGLKAAEKDGAIERRFRKPLEGLKDISFQFSDDENALYQHYETFLMRVLKEFITTFTTDTTMGNNTTRLNTHATAGVTGPTNLHTPVDTGPTF